MDSIDREVKVILQATAGTLADFCRKQEPVGVGTTISQLYDAITEIVTHANLSPAQARLVAALIPTTFAYGKAVENYRHILNGMG